MKERGFTLIELLVAVTIVSLVLLSVYGIFTSVTAARNRVAAESASSQEARVIFDRLGRELRGAWQPVNGTPFFNGGPDRDNRPELRFATASSTLAASGRGGISALRYGLQTEPDAPETLLLVRSEEPYHLRERLSQNGYPISESLRRIAFRYYGRNGWQETWDAASDNGLPRYVEVTLTLWRNNGEQVFRNIYDLPGGN